MTKQMKLLKKFKSLFNRYLNNLEKSRAFHYVHLLYYKCHKTNPNPGGLHIDSPDWKRKTKNQQ